MNEAPLASARYKLTGPDQGNSAALRCSRRSAEGRGERIWRGKLYDCRVPTPTVRL
jgi:hypothetical protein